ncbi:dipeptidyl aminopeptidase/acylaminoacyl peptidase [Murinocardiopsis flavida]|uniref:Dipeptidyl aminopeptidase/acylaminoacyl peptidase n=1 Tax=Murinocardiopsis flavida TaxID=645275 RepID=A0A2P8DUV4_9ACTN|nr:prolyl oligopeptidase family serine peptidase [Murinocardiopsis flavida]PSL00987.1 dipeptidyl aminopeptidase/acylaminoacyl peptidase [Murinocardiopsis flavida]
MTDSRTAPHGAWPSPIRAAEVAGGERRLGFPAAIGGEVWWQEARPGEDGRTTVMRRDPDGTTAELLPAPWDARTRVHEYGGRSYLPVPRRDDKAIARNGIVFTDFADQRLYLLERSSAEPRPLTPEPAAPGALRYADPVLSPDTKHVICVRESHDGDGGVGRAIVSVPLSGRAAENPEAVRELVTGADFYASPAPSPDGGRLAWVSWNHPRMPWDGTELRVGTLTDAGPVESAYTLKGGATESVLTPAWRDTDALYFVSDWPGWWNLYEIGLTGPAMALYPAEEEFSDGGGTLGSRSYCVLADGAVAALHGHADRALSRYDPRTAELTPLGPAAATWETITTDGEHVIGVAAAADTPQRLLRVHPGTGRTEILREAADTPPPPGYLPEPRTVTLPGRFGGTVPAIVHPPTHPDADPGGPAPYVVWVHGGPVSRATTALHLERAYFTSRGIGVLDVNYGGSTGYGRSHRERLHRQWGVIDVEDVTAAARALIDDGTADPRRIAVRGGSAGGLTTLLALTGDTFACGVSLCGVTDLLALAEASHDYESHVLDTLIGTLPGYRAAYRERSPVVRAADITAPVLVLQGADDPVVPPSQATALVDELKQRGTPHAYIEFPGEGHGLRSAEARRRALEAELAFYAETFGFTPADDLGETVTLR